LTSILITGEAVTSGCGVVVEKGGFDLSRFVNLSSGSGQELMDEYGPGVLSEGDILVRATYASASECTISVRWSAFDSPTDTGKLLSGVLTATSPVGTWDESSVPDGYRVSQLRERGGSCRIRVTESGTPMYEAPASNTIDLEYGVVGANVTVGITAQSATACTGSVMWLAESD
jgi:hypothetical protein